MTLRQLFITLSLLIISTCAGLFFWPKPPLLAGLSFSTAVYDRQHHLLRLTLSHDEKYRLFTPLPQISPELIATTLLQEDQYFWWHFGINPFSFIKAGWETYIVHSRRVGASTITMQLARMRFGLHSKTLSGKWLQILRAIQLEIHYSKKEILEAYLNLAPYGNNIEGVGAASLIYFNHPASQLSLPEALTLSVIPQNPTKRTFRNNNLIPIRNKLFKRWLTHHPEDSHQQTILNLPLEMRDLHALPFIAPHFVNHLLKRNYQAPTFRGLSAESREPSTSPNLTDKPQKVDVERARDSSFKPQDITTTLDIHLQTILTRITRQYIQRQHNIGANNAAILLVDARDMSIKGAVGSVDYFNRAIQGQINGTEIKRSPGSTLKPFIYGLALDQGLIHPNTILKDVPHSFGSYNPENFDYDFMGPIKARDALTLSRNIPAIDLANRLTSPTLYQLLEDAQVNHLKPESYYGLALSLGGAELTMHELTSLYAMLLNDGIWHPLRTRQDDPIHPGKRLLSPEASFLILDILNNTPRPESKTTIINTQNLPIAWKTGTSSGYRDAWSIGTFGPYVLAVWIGNFNNTGNPAFIGKKLAAPLFFELIDAIQHERGPLPVIEHYPDNLNLKHIEVCKASGMLPTRYCHDTEMTWFIPGKSPIKSDTIYREIAIDKTTGLRTCHIDNHTRFEVFEFWSTDLLHIFKQAGIQRRTPPPYMPGCEGLSTAGTSPQITSPQTELHYIIQSNTPKNTKIPLTAVTDADVSTIYWFINEMYVGKTHPNQPFLWTAKVGKFVVRVVDEHGLSDVRDVVLSYS